MMRKLLQLFVFLLWPLLVAPLFGQRDETRQQLQAQFDRLEKLDYETLKKGNTLADYQEREKIRDFFLSQGDAGARFLIEKLQAIVADEMAFMGESKDPMRFGEYLFYLIQRGKAGIAKVEVSWMLADMFPSLGPELQEESLRAITAAFRPFSFPDEWGSLAGAMFRIGPKSIPYLLELANHEDEKLRCYVSDTLNDVATRFSQTATSPRVSAPELDCQAEPAKLQSRIQQWKQWWDSYGDRVAWPQIPSFFEMYKEFRDRIK